MTTAYDFGDTAVLAVTFTVAGTPTDPTAVTARVRQPDGVIVDHSYGVGGDIVHDSAGVFHLDISCDQAGEWIWKFVGTGAAADADTGSFYVRPDISPDPAPGDLCSLRDVFRYVPGFDPTDDDNGATIATLAALITSQSVDILGTTGLEFTPINPTLNPRSFDIDSDLLQYRRLAIGEATTITSVTQKRNGSTIRTLATGDYIEEPRIRKPWQPIQYLRFPVFSSTPLWPWIEDVLEIGADWGYPSIPADVRQACAKLVIVRYLTDAAQEGTAFADAITGDINIGGLLVSAREVIGSYTVTLP